MKTNELDQYDALSQYMANQFPGTQFLVTFCLLPKEDHGRLISLVPQAYFQSGQSTILDGEPALALPITTHLTDPNFTYPISQRRFDVTILRSNGFGREASGLMRAVHENRKWPA